MAEQGSSVAFLERVILEVDWEDMILAIRGAKDLQSGLPHNSPAESLPLKSICVPRDATRSGVPAEVYDGYRLGLMSACADVVCVRDTDGKLEVPLISRAKPPFQGGWWVQGGAMHNFRSIRQFLLWKLFRESGNFDGNIEEFVETYHLGDDSLSCDGVRLVGFPLGIYRTSAEDILPGKVCDTLNLAYLALWPAGLPFGHDKDHVALRWVTLPELLADKNLCGHWYPQHLATRALQIVAAAKN